MQPNDMPTTPANQLEELIMKNYDQTQQDMKKLRAALRKLYSKMEQQNELLPIAQEQFNLRSVSPQERVQIIRYLKENVERFNEATEQLVSIHQDLKEWNGFRSELQEIKEELRRFSQTQITPQKPESAHDHTIVP
ncbi:hypothetical protein [Sulfoacidibacillus thermotolerans]|uniref:Uncharacterized protein n=1 Tax=Sulfoacidibacillus thermotolerans TaxID=1765684 RepID=A0A2U3DBP6_SULT2|nr:hypothetical protein [Sulfoacidibacillus thermotolerans]PWI58709.1 hypothetical protein BM613_01010 [Sulfoacidibacillus thermotolerans]